MPELPESNAFREAVSHELRLQFIRSIQRKAAVLAVVIAGIGTIYGLDRAKLKLSAVREQPYLATDVARVTTSAATPVPQDAEAKRVLQSAAAKLPPDERYADAKAVFDALLARTDHAAEVAKARTKIRQDYGKLAVIDRRILAATAAITEQKVTQEEEARSVVSAFRTRRTELIATRTAELAEADKEAAPAIRATYAKPLAEIDAAIRAAVMTDPQPEAKAADSARAMLATLKVQRAELIALRAAQLGEADEEAASRVAALQRAFDDLNIAEKARSKFSVTGHVALDTLIEHIVDPDHPLSIVYNMFWYTGLIAGILALSALVLTPLFRTLPVSGVEEPVMDQIRGMFGRAPRAVGMSVARVAAMTIGTAAIVSAATTIPSSPVMASALLPPPVITAITSDAKAADQDTPRQRRGEKDRDKQRTPTPNGPLSGDPPPFGNPPPPENPPPPQTPQPSAPGQQECDTCVGGLICSVRQLEIDSALYREKFAIHDQVLVALAPLPARVVRQAEQEQQQVELLEDFFRETRTNINDTKKMAGQAATQAEQAKQEAAAVARQLELASGALTKRADAIEGGVLLPYKVGERPSFASTILGFDRYRVTDSSVAYIEKAGAPDDVVAAVRALKGPEELSNDELRLSLRQQLCGKSVNCAKHLAWRETVLRAARRQ